ncbi:mitochondrial fission process protein 1 [Anthonomus grandis grandis]|uniref:mitochondrial fission process protein 1 n=1 Tax=Anthonomus grandis grandis TaxID=2921223 RepID=UPI002165392C|nr:mitochondrial fission process protein 1 [Anthonomus grandis grandis]
MDQLSEDKKVDLFRDTPVRYLGYANEVGEAFRSIIGAKWVNVTYGIATLYVLADTGHKSVESYKENIKEANHKSKVAYTTADTLIWQLLASVAIPGLTINRICALSTFALKKSEFLPQTTRKWAVTAIGLTAIPFIIKPIDRFVDLVLDESLRKYQPK